MVKKADVPKVALAAALNLAAERGWRDLSMESIAAEAGVTLVQLHEAYRSKGDILDAFIDHIDAAVLAGDSADLTGDPARDRLFDVMMRRFDALGAHKGAVRAIVAASCGDPCVLAGNACRLKRSMRWMLEAARIDTSGLAGRMRVKGLMAIHVDVLRTWLKDDSEDQAKTMAALDRRLGQADHLMATLCRLAPRRGTASAEQAA